MGGSQNGLEGDSQAARLEKDECEVTLGPGRQQLLRGLNWHPPCRHHRQLPIHTLG